MIRKPGIEFLALWMAAVLLLPCCALADSVYGDFIYVLNAEGQAVIIHYIGRDKNVELPWNIEGKMVAEIGPEAFAGNTTIETVKLPIGVTLIRENAFKGCANLKSVELPSRLETIEEGSFLGCTALKELEIPESVVEINMECFENWTLLMGNENSIAVDYAKALGLSYRETIPMASASIDDSEKPITQPESVEGKLSISRTITPEVVRAGSTVTVTYELYNSGNIELTDIQVKENISKTAQIVDILAVGQYATLTFTSRIGNMDLISNAHITYKTKDSTRIITDDVEETIIPLAKPNLSLTLSSPTANANIGDTVILMFTFNNSGNVSYSNVSIVDEKMGEILTDLDIPADSSVLTSNEFHLMEPTTFKVTAILPDNTGETHTLRAKELTIDVVDSEKNTLLTGTDQKQTEIDHGWITECDMYFNQYGLLNFDLTNYEPYEAEGRGIIYFFRPEHGSHFGQGAVSGYVLFDIVKPEIVYEYAIWCGSDDYAGVVAELGSDQVPTSAWIKFYVTDDQQIIIISSDVAINILENE